MFLLRNSGSALLNRLCCTVVNTGCVDSFLRAALNDFCLVRLPSGWGGIGGVFDVLRSHFSPRTPWTLHFVRPSRLHFGFRGPSPSQRFRPRFLVFCLLCFNVFRVVCRSRGGTFRRTDFPSRLGGCSFVLDSLGFCDHLAAPSNRNGRSLAFVGVGLGRFVLCSSRFGLSLC
jgi:hypothetical protein